jgi:hypothetical protein
VPQSRYNDPLEAQYQEWRKRQQQTDFERDPYPFSAPPTTDPLEADFAAWKQRRANSASAHINRAVASVGQSFKTAGQTLYGMVTDPVDTVVGMKDAIVHDWNTGRKPAIGETVGMSGTGMNARDILEIEKWAGPLPKVTKQSHPNAISRVEKADAGIRTWSNVAALGTGPLGKGAAVAVDAGLGALNMPDDPLAGALVGATAGAGIRAGIRGAQHGFQLGKDWHDAKYGRREPPQWPKDHRASSRRYDDADWEFTPDEGGPTLPPAPMSMPQGPRIAGALESGIKNRPDVKYTPEFQAWMDRAMKQADSNNNPPPPPAPQPRPAQGPLALPDISESTMRENLARGGFADAPIQGVDLYREATMPTPTAVKLAMEKVGRERFRELAHAEIERRGVSADVDGQKAAIEQTARAIVAGKIGVTEQASTHVPDQRVTFQTAKGSTYTVDGETTVRDKAARPEHPGSAGIQPRSQRTVYVDEAGLNALSEFQAQGASGSRRIEALPDGSIGIRYTSGPDAGKFERRTVVKPQTAPAEGLYPVELFDDGGVHFGNKITGVNKPAATATDLFGNPIAEKPKGPAQPSMFGELEGTKLAQTENLKRQNLQGAQTADEIARLRHVEQGNAGLFANLVNKSQGELGQLYDELRAADRNIAAEVFGPENGKRYEALQRAANNPFDQKKADAASAEIERMEAGLTEQQRNRLYGIGEDVPDLEAVRDARDAAGPVDDADDSYLRTTVGRELTTGKPTTDAASAIRLRNAMQELIRRNPDLGPEALIEQALQERVQAGMITPEQARELLPVRLKELKDAGIFTAKQTVAEHHKKLVAARNERIAAIGDGSKPTEWLLKNGTAYVVSREPGTKKIRVTHFDPDVGPTGHTLHDDAAGAAKIVSSGTLNTGESVVDGWMAAEADQPKGIGDYVTDDALIRSLEEVEGRLAQGIVDNSQVQLLKQLEDELERRGVPQAVVDERIAQLRAERGGYAVPDEQPGLGPWPKLETPEKRSVGAYSKLFDEPDAKDVVRLEERVKDTEYLSRTQAQTVIAGWKKHALSQKGDPRNANKVVISLFDLSGEWSKPWKDAGYQVYTFDIQANPTLGDVRNISRDFLDNNFPEIFKEEGLEVHAVLAANPCTDFAVSGARHFNEKDLDGRTQASIAVAEAALDAIELLHPSVWAVENPVSRIDKLTSLPSQWRLAFNPNHFGDPYTKRTHLWGRFNAELPTAPVAPTEGSKMWAKYGGKSQATKNARSQTPEGFAYAFFMANNAADHPALAWKNEYDKLDPKLFDEAAKAGLSDEQVRAAVEDAYWIKENDKLAEKSLREAIAKAGQPADDLWMPGQEPVGTPEQMPTQPKGAKRRGKLVIPEVSQGVASAIKNATTKKLREQSKALRSELDAIRKSKRPLPGEKVARLEAMQAELAARKAAKPPAPRRKAVAHAVNEKFRLDTDDALIQRYAEVEKRFQEYVRGDHGPPISGWTDDSGHATDKMGAFLSFETNAGFRIRDDARIMGEIKQELLDRGIPEEAIEERVGMALGDQSDNLDVDFPHGDEVTAAPEMGGVAAGGEGQPGAAEAVGGGGGRSGPPDEPPAGRSDTDGPDPGDEGGPQGEIEFRHGGPPVRQWLRALFPKQLRFDIGEGVKSLMGTLEEQIGRPLYEAFLDAEQITAQAAIEEFVKNRAEFLTKGITAKMRKATFGHMSEFAASRIADFLRKVPGIGKKFGLSDLEMRQLFHAAESISGWDKNGPIYGSFHYKATVSSQGNTGALTAPRKVRYTAAESKALLDALSPRQKEVLRRYTLNLSEAMTEGVGTFNRNVSQMLYGIQSNVEGYVRHMGFKSKHSFLRALYNASAFSTRKVKAGSRFFRKGAEGYAENLGMATLDSMIGLRLEALKNQAAAAIEAQMLSNPRIARRLPWYGSAAHSPKPKAGYREYWARHDGPNHKKGERFQVDLNVHRAFVNAFDGPPTSVLESAMKNPRMRSWIQRGGGVLKGFVGYWMKNTLLALESLVTNLGQWANYMTMVAEDAVSVPLGVPGAARRVKNAMTAPFEALKPSVREKIPFWELGETIGDLAHDQPGKIPVLDSLVYAPWFSMWGAIESHLKRSLEIVQRKEAAYRRGDTNVYQRPDIAERLHRADDRMDAFGFRYGNVPTLINSMRRSTIGKSVIPYPVFPYKQVRLLGRYAGAVGRGIAAWMDDDVARISKQDWAKIILATMMVGSGTALAFGALDDEDTAPVRTEHSDFPGELDRRNRLPLPKTDAGMQPYLRVSKYPMVNTVGAIGETVTSLKDADPYGVLRPWLDFGKDAMSLGPGVQVADAMRGMTDEYTRRVPRGALAGQLLGTLAPGYRMSRQSRRMGTEDDGRGKLVRRPKNFHEGLFMNLPFGPAGEPARDRSGRLRRYDPDVELARFLTGVNIKLVDPREARSATRKEKRRKSQ